MASALGWRPHRHLWADCLEKMWEPRRLTTLWASTACYRDSFTSQTCHITKTSLILSLQDAFADDMEMLLKHFFFFFSFYSFCSHLERRASVKRFVLLQFLNLRQSVGLLGRGISLLRCRYLTQTQNKHRHPFLEWDSNPRSPCSSGWRRFMT
jgi:hypothetical protein